MNSIYVCLLSLFVSPCMAAPALLNATDLKKAPLMASLGKLKERKGLMNELWICGKKAKATLTASCEERPAEDFYEARGVLELQVKTPIGTFDFGLRHAVPTGECRKMLRDIRKVQQKNLAYCIMGQYAGFDKEPDRVNGKPKVVAAFYQLKSHLGYVIDMDFEPEEE